MQFWVDIVMTLTLRLAYSGHCRMPRGESEMSRRVALACHADGGTLRTLKGREVTR